MRMKKKTVVTDGTCKRRRRYTHNIGTHTYRFERLQPESVGELPGAFVLHARRRPRRPRFMLMSSAHAAKKTLSRLTVYRYGFFFILIKIVFVFFFFFESSEIRNARTRIYPSIFLFADGGSDGPLRVI